MKKKIRSILQLFDYVLAMGIFVIVVLYVFCGTKNNATDDSDIERNEILKSVIVWEADYSKEIESDIVYNLNLLPDSVLNSWLSKESSVVVCPNIKGYLDKEADITDDAGFKTENYYTIAYNLISSRGDEVVGSDIYILGSSDYINNSLLHEIGHYVYYEYFGSSTDYVLPSYETDSELFIENEQKNISYFLIPNEYFAEIFAYTVKNGTTELYQDTYKMQKIIKNFAEKNK